MIKNKLFTIMVAMLMILPVSYAETTEDVEAGMTPDNVLHFIDTSFENARLYFTLNEQKRFEKHLEYATERESEMKIVEKSKSVEKAETNFQKNLAAAEKLAKTSNELELIKEKYSNHIEILNEVKEKVPESAKFGIENAISQSERKLEEKKKQLKFKTMENELANVEIPKTIKIPVEHQNYSKKFENDTFKINVEDDNSYYFQVSVEQINLIEPIPIDEVDYVITIKDKEGAIDLVGRMEGGEVVDYSDVTEVIDIPLKLQTKAILTFADENN